MVLDWKNGIKVTSDDLGEMNASQARESSLEDPLSSNKLGVIDNREKLRVLPIADD